jgi:eukaryotic-like serine/threonine-protein kinase
VDSKPSGQSAHLPHTIGRYRVIERLGRGAMGVVYSAHDDIMSRRVAIKVMMADLEDDRDASERFHREAHAAGQLMHRNIITIFDVGEQDGRPYIVMELLDGQTLGHYLKRPTGVTVEHKIGLMLQLCDGLHVAHGKGIFHRDVKPGNLLVNDEGELKIVDFGIARLATSNMTMVGVVVGTPDYMSPEQALGLEVDARSDLFSAGAVFYYMLTGRKPFASSDMHTVLERVQKDDPLPIREHEAPAVLSTIVLRALAKAPEARYQSAAEMSAALRGGLRDVTAETERASEELYAEAQALASMATRRRALSEELRATVELDEARRVGAEVETRFSDVLSAPPRAGAHWHWASVRSRRADVADLRSALHDDVTRLNVAATELQRGRAALERGDVEHAIRSLDTALQAVPSSGAVVELHERARMRLAERQAAETRARALLLEAEEAAARTDWSTVIALTTEAMDTDQQNTAVARLHARAVTAKREAAERRRAECESALTRAEALAAKGRYDEAETALADVRRVDPTHARTTEVEARIRAARLDAERASAAERRAAEIVAASRQAFERGERHEALAALREFLAREPGVPLVTTTLATLEREAERRAEEERRRLKAEDLTRQATEALERDEPERALTLVRDALQLYAKDAGARRLEGMATARVKERALQRERAEAAQKALESAQAALARGKFRVAADLAQRAAALRPDDDAPAALVARIHAAEAQALEDARLAEEARRRAAAAAPVVAKARAAEAARDLVRAEWLAENALALDATCAEARAIVERARAALSAEPELADKTVRLGVESSTVHDPDATVSLGTPRPAWRQGVTLARRFGAFVSGLGRKASSRQ